MKSISLYVVFVFVLSIILPGSSYSYHWEDTGFISFTQPDGSQFTARSWGDIFYHWTETEDGYRIVVNENGWWCFSELGSEGDFTPSKFLVGKDKPPASAKGLMRSPQCLATIDAEKSLYEARLDSSLQWYKEKQRQAVQETSGKSGINASPANPTVSITLGLVFVEFQDKKHYKDQNFPDGFNASDFTNMMFSTGHYYDTDANGITSPTLLKVYGSFADYWYEQSLGELVFSAQSGIVNPVAADTINWSYYTLPYNKQDFHNHHSCSEISNEFNLTNLLAINGGIYDRIAVIYAGGRPSNRYGALTTQAWGFYGGAYRFYEVPEVTERYGQPQFYNIGGHCHEFGHVIGLNHHDSHGRPFYWILMHVGDLNGPDNRFGACPAGINPASKVEKLGWGTYAGILDNDVTDYTISYNYSSPLYYKIPTNIGPDKYLILENRLRDGFDEFTPYPEDDIYGWGVTPDPTDRNGNQGGMLIWRVNGSYFGIGNPRLVFADNDHPMNSEEWGDYSDLWMTYSKDQFPVIQGQDFNPNTAPSTNFGNNQSHLALQDITWDDNDKTVSFDLYTNYYGSSHSWSGTITESMTWAGTAHITDDLTIDNNAVLTILPGTTVEVESGNSIQVENGAKLKALGTSNNPITFDHDGSGEWAGITFYSGSDETLEYCTFDHVEEAVTCFNSRPAIRYRAFTDGYYDIKSYYYTSAQQKIQYNSFFSNDNVGVYLYSQAAEITGNEFDGEAEDTESIRVRYYSGGLSGMEILNNTIFNSVTYGIRLDHARGYIKENDIYNNGFGVYSTSYSDPHFWQTDEDGLNVITGNDIGVYISSNSDADLDYSWSTIAGNSSYNLYNLNSSITVLARDNYWGASPPPVNKFHGNVNYTPYEDEDKTGRYPLGFAKNIIPDGENQYGAPPSSHADSLITALFQNARSLERNGNSNSATEQYSNVIALNPDHDLAIMAFYRYIGLQADMNRNTVATDVREIANQYKNTRVAAWALKYLASQAAHNGHFEEARRLSHQIVDEYSTTDAARDALYEEWILSTYAFEDSKSAVAIIFNYENLYGTDENLIEMKLTAGLIDGDTARELKTEYLGKKNGAGNQSELSFVDIPDSYILFGNYPNPFNPITNIKFGLPEKSIVTIKVYDLSGRLVQNLANTYFSAGYQNIEFDGHDFSSGMYLYRITAKSLETNKKFTQTGRMLLLK